MITGGTIAVKSDERSRNDFGAIVSFVAVRVYRPEEGEKIRKKKGGEKGKKRKRKKKVTCRETHRIFSRTPHAFNDS